MTLMISITSKDDSHMDQWKQSNTSGKVKICKNKKHVIKVLCCLESETMQINRGKQ